jgi:hypothetical protein
MTAGRICARRIVRRLRSLTASAYADAQVTTVAWKPWAVRP